MNEVTIQALAWFLARRLDKASPSEIEAAIKEFCTNFPQFFPMNEVTNEELCALVLSWCKAEHPDHYEKTLRAATDPVKFRKYLLRLVEVRAAEDIVWRNSTCPIRVLDETSMVINVRQKSTGAVRAFKGKRAPGPLDHRLIELTSDPDGFRALQNLKSAFDLVHAP